MMKISIRHKGVEPRIPLIPKKVKELSKSRARTASLA
jgi:hypothetical protein